MRALFYEKEKDNQNNFLNIGTGKGPEKYFKNNAGSLDAFEKAK